MALPADFSKIYGSTATGGLTPISDVNYAKGWEFVGSIPPTKNDFSYLQNLSDLKSQWLYSNKLQRANPFGDIKSDGSSAIAAALSNLGLGGVPSGMFPIGMPFYWPNAKMPNELLPEWSGMTFLKWNDATFSAAIFPKLALVIPSLKLTESRGEFIRNWDDGRGVDAGRTLLSAQLDAMQKITGSVSDVQFRGWGGTSISSGSLSNELQSGITGNSTTGGDAVGKIKIDTSLQSGLRIASENRPRNIAFNFLVRAA